MFYTFLLLLYIWSTDDVDSIKLLYDTVTETILNSETYCLGEIVFRNFRKFFRKVPYKQLSYTTFLHVIRYTINLNIIIKQ